MDAQRQVWHVHGLRLDLYDVAALHPDPDLMVAVAAAELYQAGVLATDQRALVKTRPLPPDAHPVERAVYEAIADEAIADEAIADEAIADEALALPGRGTRRGAPRAKRPTGRDVLERAARAAAVSAIRRRLGRE